MFRCCATRAHSAKMQNIDTHVTELQISDMKEVIVEVELNRHTHKRIAKFEGDLNALRAAIFNVYVDVLGPEIAKVSGKSSEEIGDTAQQQGILKQYLHVEVYNKKFKAFVDVEDAAADVKDGDTLRAFVRETNLVRSSGLPNRPSQLWCPAHEKGQGFIRLGGATGDNTSNGKVAYEVNVDGMSCLATDDTSSVVYFEHVKDASIATYKLFFQKGEKLYIGYKTDLQVIATTDTADPNIKFIFTFENGKYTQGYGMFWKILWGDVKEATKESDPPLKTENLIGVTDKNKLQCINNVVAEWFTSPACLFSISALSATGNRNEQVTK